LFKITDQQNYVKPGIIITRTVWTLSFVSLFTDMASEMLYPVMPVFLKSIGFSILLIGLLEGIAEGTAGISKGYFGKLSDTSGRRVPFVQIGYALSALAKPLMAVSVYPLWIFIVRTTDRLGKGIRTGARDAILSTQATPETKARIFGLHRSFDTAGAFLGPSLALVFLYFYPAQYKLLFLAALLPGVAAILLTLLLKEVPASTPKKTTPSFFSFLSYWNQAPSNYRKLVGGLLFFTLINSSDVFLLLKVKEAGLSDPMVIGVYIFYNLVYALASYPAGHLADHWGLKKTMIVGLVLFSIVYAGMALPFHSTTWFAGLFLLYGLYAACTESIAKAWITNMCDPKDTATAVGSFTAFQSICTLIASVVAGGIWYLFGAGSLFIATGVFALAIAVYFMRIRFEGE
jgi:MFS family permease